MPTFEKSPPELVARFDEVLNRFDGTKRRKMFGYPAAFVGGNLVTSLHETRWVVRLPDEERAELLALPGAKPFEPMPGRPTTGYACLPPSIVDDDAALDRWVARALAFGGTLPLKR